MLKNFSKHYLNKDQIRLLDKLGYAEVDPEPIAPHWENSTTFVNDVEHSTIVAVVPAHILLEAIAKHVTVNIIMFEADQAARKIGKFATKKVKEFKIKNGIIEEIREAEIDAPSVAVDFRTGEEVPYEVIQQ